MRAKGEHPFNLRALGTETLSASNLTEGNELEKGHWFCKNPNL